MFPFNDMMEISPIQRNEAVSGLSSLSNNTTLQAHKKVHPSKKPTLQPVFQMSVLITKKSVCLCSVYSGCKSLTEDGSCFHPAPKVS